MSDPLNEPGPAETPRRKTSLAVKVVLAVSLALNLLVVGVVVGAVSGRIGPAAGDEPPDLRSLGLGPFAIALGHDGRDAVREALRDRRAEFIAERRAIGNSLRSLQQALLQDPFDRDAAAAAMAESRAAAEALQSYGHEALLDHLASLPLEEREELAQHLNRAMRRVEGHDRDGDRDRDHDGDRDRD